MDLIKFLISYFLEGEEDSDNNNGQAQNIFNMFSQNSGFDLSKILSFLPMLSSFGQNKGSSVTPEPENPLLPITNVCDKEILNSLNNYLAEN